MSASLNQPSGGETLQTLRGAIRDQGTWEEERAVTSLLHALELTGGARHRAVTLAMGLVAGARARRDERPFLDAFLQEFGLSNQEGIALMCIAEALLRIPDDATADRLIAEKLATGDWSAHSGRSESLFVNASTWGLMLTGGILDLDPAIKSDAGGWLRTMTRKAGEPLVRLAVRRAMKIIGGEFVVGRSIEEALARSARDPDVGLCSFDMLGEGARTSQDAERYLKSYQHAIQVIGAAAASSASPAGSTAPGAGAPRATAPGPAPHLLSSISIKLSALEPRYNLLQRARVMQRLTPPLKGLAVQAASLGIQLTIDAEEADRLDLSLDLIEALAEDPATREWPGLGLAVQAYGKRALGVIDWVAALARRCGRRMTVRLVKGAYWDSEIKRAQERGLAGYPVFTRKLTTDVSYLACAGRLFKNNDVIYPQFATHNAHSIAAVLQLAPPGANYEFQRLHGMGQLLYAEAARQIPDFPRVRVYAPVGEHKDLLAYLVRRLLENGANTSFVNRFMDEQVPVADIVRDPISELERASSIAHSRLSVPAALYAARRNSAGIDLGNPLEVQALREDLARRSQPNSDASGDTQKAGAGSGAGSAQGSGAASPGAYPIFNPADRRMRVGFAQDATPARIAAAFDRAAAAQAAWDHAGGEARASCLEKGS
jgi:RHH-type proline utilization regulon transcriptional repressor/proline dehydrogenase/delta 1-pyrroline-5-carboxylate dehydrogenase